MDANSTMRKTCQLPSVKSLNMFIGMTSIIFILGHLAVIGSYGGVWRGQYNTQVADKDDRINHHDTPIELQESQHKSFTISDNLVVAKQKERPKDKLIDFIIAGFSKCGTTTMQNRLNENPQVYMGGPQRGRPVQEVHDLRFWDREQIFFDRYTVEKINSETNLTAPDGTTMKQVIGFKSPEVVRSEPFLRHVVKLFPKVNMIVSVRHPILHFQSLYNYMTRDAKGAEYLDVPKSNKLIGFCGADCDKGTMKFTESIEKCTPELKFLDGNGDRQQKSVCTYMSYFHYGLSRLALTPLSKEEWELLDHHKWSLHPEWEGKLFLMELGQLEDEDSKRLGKLERSIESFLGLREKSYNATKERKALYKYFHICDDEHRKLRGHLVKKGGNAARWIKDYLLESDRIVVPNKEHFIDLIDKWGTDPCKF